MSESTKPTVVINQPIGPVVTPPPIVTPEAFKTPESTSIAVVIPSPVAETPPVTVTDKSPTEVGPLDAHINTSLPQEKEPDPIRVVVNNLLVSSSTQAKISNADKIPSNWQLEPGDDEFPLHGSNTITGLLFKGTHAEFNQLLRG